jgi:plastocyanin
VSFQTAARASRRSLPNLSMLALAIGLLALSGCGSSSSSTSSPGPAPASTPATTATTSSPTPSTPTTSSGEGKALALAANTEGLLKFDTTSLSAKAGKVSIAFTNTASLEHNLTVASPSGSVLGATPTFQGGSKTLSLTLKPGVYTFYCSVPGHRQGGMEGTLTVK